MMAHVLDLRCPVDRRRMFGRLVLQPGVQIVEGNLLEFACDVCRRREGVKQVFHRFDIAGRLIETEQVK